MALLVVAIAGGCARDAVDREALLDPASCQGCHPQHVEEWASSMHAHASDDPVFLAVNRLGHRATGGALGDFCVRCHAPVAVAGGWTTTGLDLDEVPRAVRGVTCVACHQIEGITALHNGGLTWAEDDVMRGALTRPVATGAHRSAYSPLLDSARLGSSDACGACHDVIAPWGVVVEATYAEWAGSVFATPGAGVSCGGCHMAGREGVAAHGGPPRRIHDHRMAAVDLPLVPWPGADAQRLAIDRDLARVLDAALCVVPAAGGVRVDVTLDNVLAGHAFPSGVTHARRAWVELIAEEDGAVTFARGRFAAGEVVSDADGAWVLRSRFVDAAGAVVDHVWDAQGIESDLLAPAVTSDPNDPRYYHAQTRSWLVPGQPDRISAIVRLEPIGLDVLDALIAAGELDPEIRERMPRFELSGTARQWQRDRDGTCAP
jgi:hypothetical protein